MSSSFISVGSAAPLDSFGNTEEVTKFGKLVLHFNSSLDDPEDEVNFRAPSVQLELDEFDLEDLNVVVVSALMLLMLSTSSM